MRPAQRAARLLLGAAALLALSTGCGHAGTSAAGTSAASTPAASTPGAGTAATSTAAAGAAAASTPAAVGDDASAFCALAREKGAADLLNLRDGSAPGGGLDKVLANLDVLTAAAPAGIKGDYTRLDQLEHALLGRHRDPQQLARVDNPDTIASLQRIQRYLASNCGIR